MRETQNKCDKFIIILGRNIMGFLLLICVWIIIYILVYSLLCQIGSPRAFLFTLIVDISKVPHSFFPVRGWEFPPDPLPL